LEHHQQMIFSPTIENTNFTKQSELLTLDV
jgi:hypothetical protein